jgi:hypothetical protein
MDSGVSCFATIRFSFQDAPSMAGVRGIVGAATIALLLHIMSQLDIFVTKILNSGFYDGCKAKMMKRSHCPGSMGDLSDPLPNIH